MSSLSFEVKSSQGTNTYVLDYPNVGQFYDIETSKQQLSKNQFGGLAATATLPAQHAADMIEIESVLRILCPKKFFEDLRVSSIRELGLKDYVQLREAYFKQVEPWMREIYEDLKILNDDQGSNDE